MHAAYTHPHQPSTLPAPPAPRRSAAPPAPSRGAAARAGERRPALPNHLRLLSADCRLCRHQQLGAARHQQQHQAGGWRLWGGVWCFGAHRFADCMGEGEREVSRERGVHAWCVHVCVCVLPPARVSATSRAPAARCPPAQALESIYDWESPTMSIQDTWRYVIIAGTVLAAARARAAAWGPAARLHGLHACLPAAKEPRGLRACLLPAQERPGGSYTPVPTSFPTRFPPRLPPAPPPPPQSCLGCSSSSSPPPPGSRTACGAACWPPLSWR